MWPNPQETADLVTFTEEILNGKLHFLCSATIELVIIKKIMRKSTVAGEIPFANKTSEKKRCSLFVINLIITCFGDIK